MGMYVILCIVFEGLDFGKRTFHMEIWFLSVNINSKKPGHD